MRWIFTLFITISLFSCKHTNKQTAKPGNAPIPQLRIVTTDTLPHQKNINPDFPADTNYTARLLLAGGVFHEDEVDPKSVDYEWMGLFRTDSNYYMAPTRVKLSRDFDIVIDDEGGKKTGWTVKTTGKDSALYLISGLKYLQKRAIDSIPLIKYQLMPGNQIHFFYQGIKYTLYATGNKISENSKSESYQISDYHLFIKATINNQPFDQELVFVNEFDDALTEILFAGDIDGDGRPDLILNTTNHYNVVRPTLYLSKPAQTGELLKVMGMFTMVGC